LNNQLGQFPYCSFVGVAIDVSICATDIGFFGAALHV